MKLNVIEAAQLAFLTGIVGQPAAKRFVEGMPLLSSSLSCLSDESLVCRARPVNSTRQVKVALYLIQTMGWFLSLANQCQRFFSQVQVFEVFEMMFDRLANIERRRPAGHFREVRQGLENQSVKTATIRAAIRAKGSR